MAAFMSPSFEAALLILRSSALNWLQIVPLRSSEFLLLQSVRDEARPRGAADPGGKRAEQSPARPRCAKSVFTLVNAGCILVIERYNEMEICHE